LWLRRYLHSAAQLPDSAISGTGPLFRGLSERKRNADKALLPPSPIPHILVIFSQNSILASEPNSINFSISTASKFPDS
jgi:hypothetical protein